MSFLEFFEIQYLKQRKVEEEEKKKVKLINVCSLLK